MFIINCVIIRIKRFVRMKEASAVLHISMFFCIYIYLYICVDWSDQGKQLYSTEYL